MTTTMTTGPVPSVIRTRLNGPLIYEAARLWIDDDDVILDCTWGRGLWWTHYRPHRLIRHDLDLDGVDFRHLPEADGSIDVVAFDPPYVSPGGRATSTIPDFNDRYGLDDVPADPAATDSLVADGITEAARVLSDGGRLLVKCMDYISGGRYHQGHHHTVDYAAAAGLVQVDEIIHLSRPGAQPRTNLDGSFRRQVHSRRVHSFLCVFRNGV